MDKQSITSIGQISEYGGGDSYKEKIVEMIGEINNEKNIKMIYGFVMQLHNKAGGR